jgi:hypothetical protein
VIEPIVVRLGGIAGDPIGAAESASHAAVNDHQSFAGSVIHSLRTHEAMALRCSITWRDVHVPGPQAQRTVIAVTAVRQRHYRSAAVLADESPILGRPADGSASRLKK